MPVTRKTPTKRKLSGLNLQTADYARIQKIANGLGIRYKNIATVLLRGWDKLSPSQQAECVINKSLSDSN